MLSMLLLASAAASSPPPIAVLPPSLSKELAPLCKPAGPQLVTGKPGKPVVAQKLNELPNADAYLAVVRRDEHGCDEPAIVAYDIGNAPRRADARPQH